MFWIAGRRSQCRTSRRCARWGRPARRLVRVRLALVSSLRSDL